MIPEPVHGLKDLIGRRVEIEFLASDELAPRPTLNIWGNVLDVDCCMIRVDSFGTRLWLNVRTFKAIHDRGEAV